MAQEQLNVLRNAIRGGSGVNRINSEGPIGDREERATSPSYACLGLVRVLSGAFISLVLTAACAERGNLPNAHNYTASIEYVSSWSIGGTPMPEPTPLVLYDQQFLDFFESGYLLALGILPPPQSVDVTWASSNADVIQLQQQAPFSVGVPDDPAPTAPPNAIYAKTGPTYGTSTITAKATGSANVSASIISYHYPSLSFGCRFRYQPAFAFDPDRSDTMRDQANWTSADIYETAPANQLGQLDPCQGSPLAVADTTETWHVPYGGVLLPAVSLQDFASISASRWQNAGTSFPRVDPSLILFKTREGRIVKALLPIGPYEISAIGGAFPY
jgi:hypothetical protein